MCHCTDSDLETPPTCCSNLVFMTGSQSEVSCFCVMCVFSYTHIINTVTNFSSVFVVAYMQYEPGTDDVCGLNR